MTDKPILSLALPAHSDRTPPLVPVTLLSRREVMMTRQQAIEYAEKCRQAIFTLRPENAEEKVTVGEIVLAEWCVADHTAAIAALPKGDEAIRYHTDQRKSAARSLRDAQGRLEFGQTRRRMSDLTAALNRPALSTLIH